MPGLLSREGNTWAWVFEQDIAQLIPHRLHIAGFGPTVQPKPSLDPLGIAQHRRGQSAIEEHLQAHAFNSHSSIQICPA